MDVSMSDAPAVKCFRLTRPDQKKLEWELNLTTDQLYRFKLGPAQIRLLAHDSNDEYFKATECCE